MDHFIGGPSKIAHTVELSLISRLPGQGEVAGDAPSDIHSRAQLLSLSLTRSGMTAMFQIPKQSSDTPRRYACILNSVLILVEDEPEDEGSPHPLIKKDGPILASRLLDKRGTGSPLPCLGRKVQKEIITKSSHTKLGGQ